jgi:hypothetical protein
MVLETDSAIEVQILLAASTTTGMIRPCDRRLMPQKAEARHGIPKTARPFQNPSPAVRAQQYAIL